MNFLYRAIDQKLFVTNNEKLKRQTWKEFEEAAEKRKIWLFGLGKGAQFFWEKYHFSFRIAGVIDNDERKWGRCLRDYVGITDGNEEGEIVIKGAEALYKLHPEENVFIISSVRYYEEIAAQLEALGFHYAYVIIIMEANEEQRNIAYKNSTQSVEDRYAAACMKYPIEKQKILVYAGKLGGHGKEISKKLAEIDRTLDIVWIVEDQETEIPQGVRSVFARRWKEYIKELETAYIWLFGETIPLFAKKRPEQIYIQTKHWASITLKKFYCDISDHLKIPSVKELYLHNNRATDYIFVGSKFDEESCRRGFDFKGECIYVGSPRSDILFCPGMKEKICSFYGISTDKHILLYSPTFRAISSDSFMGKLACIDLDFGYLRETLNKKFGGEWIIFLRVHPNVMEQSSKVKRPPFVIDTSYYPESQELVAASDIMITDYSSIMFEPAFIGKPVFLYAPDKDEYVGKERDVLIDYDSLPFSVSESNEELMEAILQFDEKRYKENVEHFLEFYGVHEDGRASERAAEFILKLLN